MILTCPACTTHYKVDAASFGTAPRLVRCANCGAQWTQHPGGQAPTAAPEAIVAPPVRPQGEQVAGGISAGAGASRPAMTGPTLPRSQPEHQPHGAARFTDASAHARHSNSGQDGRLAGAAPDGDENLVPVNTRRRGNRVMIGFLTLCLGAAAAIGSYLFAPQLSAAVPQAAPYLTPWVAQVDQWRGKAGEVIAGLAPKTRHLVVVDAEHDFQDTANGPAIIVYGHVANNSPQPLSAPKVTISLKDSKDMLLFGWDVQVEGKEVDGLKGMIPAGGSARFWARSMFPPESTEKVTVRIKE